MEDTSFLQQLIAAANSDGKDLPDIKEVAMDQQQATVVPIGPISDELKLLVRFSVKLHQQRKVGQAKIVQNLVIGCAHMELAPLVQLGTPFGLQTKKGSDDVTLVMITRPAKQETGLAGMAVAGDGVVN